MGLQTTGAISAQNINTELGKAPTTLFSLNSSDARGLAGIASGTISYSDFYGKSSFSYERAGSPSLLVSTYSSPYRKMWYQYDLGISNQPRTVVWMAGFFGSAFNTREFVDAGADGSLYSPAPTSFVKRIHYAADINSDGYWLMVLEMTIPAGQRFVEFYTVNMDYEICGYDYDEYVCTTNPAPTTRMISDAGVYVITGNLTYRHAEVNINNVATAPATATGKAGRMAFIVADGNFVYGGIPIAPYTDRWTSDFVGSAMKYDSTPVGDTQFVGISATVIGLVSYDIG